MRLNADKTEMEVSPSEELIINQIYEEMYQSVRQVIAKYLSKTEFYQGNNTNSNQKQITNTMEYPMYIFLAQVVSP